MANNGKALEQLVAKIQEIIKDRECTSVEVNTRLKDRDDILREFDVVVRTTNQGLPSVIVFECKDYSTSQRKTAVDIKVIDSFVSKCNDVPEITQRIIVSTTGFSNNAKTKAHKNGIILLSMEEVSLDSILQNINPTLLKNISQIGKVLIYVYGDNQTIVSEDVLSLWDTTSDYKVDFCALFKQQYVKGNLLQEYAKLFIDNGYKPLNRLIELSSKGKLVLKDNNGQSYPLHHIYIPITINFTEAEGQAERIQRLKQGNIEVTATTFSFSNSDIKLDCIDVDNNQHLCFEKDGRLKDSDFQIIL